MLKRQSNNSKRVFLSSLLTFFYIFSLSASSWVPPVGETLRYDITYKWGLVTKKAGEVSITTSDANENSHFKAMITGATVPWADKFYMVRDTLRGQLGRMDMLPVYYEKLSHEGGEYQHDHIAYTRTPDGLSTTGNTRRWHRKRSGEETTYTERQHQAEGATFDMLSSFYYMRSLPFPTLKKGAKFTVNVFSARRKEILTITYRGETDVKINGNKIPSYHVTFTFTSAGGKKTSDDLEAWISTTPQRIPLLMEGALPIGKIRAILSGT